MNILVVGNGGREHALLWKLRRDRPDASFFATRPNGGMIRLAQGIDLAPTDVEAVTHWAVSRSVDLVVVGPEAPLAAGLVDRLEEAGIPAFGPTAAAAEIESSKAFAKELMRRHGIPTAEFRVFSDRPAAEAWISEKGAPIVVKASGLAAGKGAVVCETEEAANRALREMLEEESLGAAGREVVVEEFMRGEELSVFALADGEHVLPLVPSQDHKRIGEGDTGPNTGGMGAYAPVSIVTPELMERVRTEILEAAVSAMAEEGRPFRGLLYAGLMLTPTGPKVVEFNCRFGDPETQVVLPLVADSLLEPVLEIARGGSLAGVSALATRPGAAVTTVLSSAGYPGDYRKGSPIEIPAELEDDVELLVFHAGTALRDGRLLTAGGRVLAVTGLAEDVIRAAERSRSGAERIRFDGGYFRRDIAWREIDRSG